MTASFKFKMAAVKLKGHAFVLYFEARPACASPDLCDADFFFGVLRIIATTEDFQEINKP